MSTRPVMAARFGPASLRSGPRNVYVCVSEKTNPDNHELIQALLGKTIRANDRLFYPDAGAGVGSVTAFAEKHGLFATPMAGDNTPPDLVIVIVDPLGDNTFTSLARVLATRYGADLIISELPVITA